VTSKKVLILTADVAGGHRATATALTQLWEQKYPDTTVKTVDLFTTTDVAPFNTSNASYELFSKNNTLLFINNILFMLFNTAIGYWGFRMYTLSRLFYPTLELLEHEQPDLIVINHPIVAMVVAAVRARLSFATKVAVLVVDIGTIWKCWAQADADLLISPAPVVTDQLIRHGVSSDKIVGDLFPLKPSLGDIRSRELVIQELGLDATKPVILLTGGGAATTHLVKAVQKLSAHPDWQVVVLCGRLAELADVLEAQYVNNPRVKVLRFQERMQDLFAAADLVIAKPGPTTIVELELCEAKALLTKEIGAQEFGNLDFALHNPNFTQIGYNWGKLIEMVETVLATPKQDFHVRFAFTHTQQIVDTLAELIK
jgi:UDP-N-acetylglucosamine:LPS N-acetylglucosamine transferase